MIKFFPRELPEDENVNISPGKPLPEFFKLLAIIAGSLVGLYILLGFLVGLIVPHISPETEKAMGRLFNGQFCVSEIKEESARLQKIVDEFNPLLSDDDRRLDYRLFVSRNPLVNAVALPGGTIVVYSGLLDQVESEGEIAFVLAHELGHFHHRHHLKGLGRALVALTVSIAIFGDNSPGTRFIFETLGQAEMKFSRGQEKSADMFALDLLKKRYGNADGGPAFMHKLAAKETRWKLLYYFSSHPHPADRLAYMQKHLSQNK